MSETKRKGGVKVHDPVSGPLRRVNVNIDKETHDILINSGMGGVSATIRILAKAWKKKTHKTV